MEPNKKVDNREFRIATIAVPLSGNKGSVSMLLSLIENFTKSFENLLIDVYSYYPERDKERNSFSNVKILSGTPLKLLLNIIPLSFLYFVFKKVGITIPISFLGKEVRTLLDADLYLGVGGTTFSDAKLIKVVFNILCLLPAKFLGLRLMLYPQTMGPFENPFNRIMAKSILPYADLIIGRGRGSVENLKKLGLKNVEFSTDGAFSLGYETENVDHILEKYQPLFKNRSVVGITPNSIVEGYCKKYNIDYAKIYGEFIKKLLERDYLVVLIAHSMRKGSKSRHNNDLLTINDILQHVSQKNDIVFLEEDYSYLELRKLIGLTNYFVASRFHSMISALYEKIPTLVVSWGYQKYTEVMDEFDLSEYIVSFNQISEDSLINGFEKIVNEEKIIKDKIDKHLPHVIDNSKRIPHLVRKYLV